MLSGLPALRAGVNVALGIVVLRAAIHGRVASARSARCAWTGINASLSPSPRACTRAAHAYTAACALRAHARAVARPFTRAARLNAARSSRSRFVATRWLRQKAGQQGGSRIASRTTPPWNANRLRPGRGKSVTVGALPRHPVPFFLLTLRRRRSRHPIPAEAEPDNRDAASCLTCTGAGDKVHQGIFGDARTRVGVDRQRKAASHQGCAPSAPEVHVSTAGLCQ